MGRWNPSTNNIWQEVNGAAPNGVFSAPAWFNGAVYFSEVNSNIKRYVLSAAKLPTTGPSSQSPTSFTYPGSSPAISANGTAAGIVWAHENSSPAVLHAYDATNLSTELYNSNQAAKARDQFGPGNKFITPAIADGKVFVGTQTAVAVFGLLH
jgi:hypothetical protein